MATLSRRRPPPLLCMPSRPRRQTARVCSETSGPGSVATSNVGQEALRAGAVRVGDPQLAAGRDQAREQLQRGVDVGLRVEHVGGQDEVERAARDQRVAVLGQSTCATSPSTSLSASTCAANATASVAPSVASTCAPRAGGDDARQREPAAELEHSGSRRRRVVVERSGESDAGRPRARPVRDRTAGAALLVAQLLPARPGRRSRRADAAHADVQQRRRELVDGHAAQRRELLGERRAEGDQRIGHESLHFVKAMAQELRNRPCGGRYGDIVQAIGNTPLVELKRLSPKPGVRLWAKLESHNPTGSVKDRVARALIEDAEEKGAIRPGQTILEPTSGNTGISLAMICSRKGYKLKVVMPDNVTPERTQLLQMYGAEIVYSPGNLGSNGAVELALKMAAEDSSYYMPYQYGNAANPGAHYHGTAPEILEELDEVAAFVAGLGTGGTLMGVGRRLREELGDAVKIVAAEPMQGEPVQGLRSLDDGFIPPIIDLSLLDRKIFVTNHDAVVWTKKLLDEEGIFAGVSTGAIASIAVRIARELDEGNVVFIVCDDGWKYLSSGLYTKPVEELENLDTHGLVVDAARAAASAPARLRCSSAAGRREEPEVVPKDVLEEQLRRRGDGGAVAERRRRELRDSSDARVLQIAARVRGCRRRLGARGARRHRRARTRWRPCAPRWPRTSRPSGCSRSEVPRAVREGGRERRRGRVALLTADAPSSTPFPGTP